MFWQRLSQIGRGRGWQRQRWKNLIPLFIVRPIHVINVPGRVSVLNLLLSCFVGRNWLSRCVHPGLKTPSAFSKRLQTEIFKGVSSQ